MMKSPIIGLLIMISFLLIAGRSNGRLLVKNNQFISPDNPSGFDPSVDSLVDDGSRVHTADGHVEKNAVQYDRERSPGSSLSVNSATKEQKLSFRLSTSVQKTENIKPNSVFNFLQKGRVTPPGSSPIVNSMVDEHELSTSKGSPGVGHMQMIRSKSQTIRVRILKSDDGQGDDHVQQETSNMQTLGSNPSPGGGN
jgi:hypothetical protein